jgi:hypothetical protein
VGKMMFSLKTLKWMYSLKTRRTVRNVTGDFILISHLKAPVFLF